MRLRPARPARPAGRRRFPRFAALATAALLAGCAASGGSSSGCPALASELPTEALYGQWEARIEGQPQPARVELHKHPEYDGVRGTVTRAGRPPAQLAGDIDLAENRLALDESQDGRRISASWSATLQPGSCGTRFAGQWHDAANDRDHPFTLDKVQGSAKP